MIRLLLSATMALTIFSCEEESSSTSYITSFEKYTVTTATPAVTIDEAVISEGADTVIFVFEIDDRQDTDVDLSVSVGSSSTATEGVDFDLLTHDVELLAYQGQDGFSIPIVVYEDLERENEDEVIYLTFTTAHPSGVEVAETKVVTIEDSGIDGVGLELTWDFASSVPTDATDGDLTPCDFDVDLTIAIQDGSPYTDDVLDNAMASSTCGEQGRLSLAALEEGEVYEVWFIVYGPGADMDFGDFAGLNLHLSYDRKDSDLAGTYDLTEVFDVYAGDTGVGGVFLTIERNGDIVTIKDADGEVVNEGRVSSKSTSVLQNVIKPAHLK